MAAIRAWSARVIGGALPRRRNGNKSPAPMTQRESASAADGMPSRVSRAATYDVV